MGKGEEQKETSQQRALAEVGMAKMQNWKKVWFPLLQRAGVDMTRMAQPGSFESKHAAGMATTDVAARFAGVKEAIDTSAGQRGVFGSSAHKLALTGAGSDQAISSALAKTGAQEAVTDTAISGMGNVMRVAQGQEAQAINGLARSADISGQQAAADAEASLQRRIGNASLAGRAVGIGLGAVAGNDGTPEPYTYDYRGTTLPNELRGGR